jgi:hypothetical protein
MANPSQTNTDGDGQGNACDADDDNDGIPDINDSCPAGETGWISDSVTDKDGDGCRDATEDTDDDNDGISDSVDNCPLVPNPGQIDTDQDGDGVQDGGETGLNGVTIELLNSSNSVIATTTTSGDGNYTFSSLAAGTYSIRVVSSTLPSGYTPTYDLDGTGTAHIATVTLTAGQNRTDLDFGYRQPPVMLAIHDIQGSAHISPYAGQTVSNVAGIVTVTTSNGFYFQTPDAGADADLATSEGMFVFTSSAPTVNVGDDIQVSGTVTEFRPGGSGTANLTITEIT